MMRFASLMPIAAVPPAPEAADGVRYLTSFQWQRLSEFDDPRDMWLIVFGVVALAAVYVYWVYRQERNALGSWRRWLLPTLRLIAVLGAVVYFLGPEKRVDKQETRDSDVVLLFDSSQSMSVEDEAGVGDQLATRLDAATGTLREFDLLASLRQNNNVSISAFDVKTYPLGAFARQKELEQGATENKAKVEWEQLNSLPGHETRLGDALKNALRTRGDAAIAGIVVFSDGGSNGGVDPLAIADLAAEREIPIYTVGLGSTQPRRNLRVQQINVPARVYPQDRTTVRGVIHSEGFAGRTVEVELLAREVDSPNEQGDRVGRQQITFLQETEQVPVEFEIEPAEVGRLALEMRVAAPTDDQYSGDNSREAELEVVEARTKTLLISGGPGRDYRFLRNQLRRDEYATVDVWLQSSGPGLSQDADRILDSFPLSREELYNYDCIVAFDPDWTQLDARQVDWLESWVAEEAGGLIVVAGPIHTSVWSQSAEHLKIRSLYPVEFQRRLTLLDDGLYGSAQPWPIEFTQEGEFSEFLWLADSMDESRALWSSFDGVFGCYAVKGPKPGARVLGRFGDPDAGLSEQRPVYMAEQFYGSGRVLYFGSGELWRLRSLDLGLFEVLYTKLIRHVSQGRLMRGSAEGHLLVERQRYTVGEEVVVRARLLSAQREPLPTGRVTARVLRPDDSNEPLHLLADPDRPGNFIGQFDVRREGSYRIVLSLPNSTEEPLTQLIQVNAPNLEFERTRRNEDLLRSLASQTGGTYYASISSAVEGTPDLPALSSRVESRAEIVTRQGTPDKEFTERIHQALLGLICGALCCEWLLRRLWRLA